jgi:hypothetical protein
MRKQPKRWPIWKIAVVTGGLAVVAIVLFWLSVLTERATSDLTTNPAGRTLALTPGGMIMMAGIVAGAFAVLGCIWLGFRIREALRPEWERGRGKKRR